MNKLTSFIYRCFQTSKVDMKNGSGRWEIVPNQQVTFKKVDWANEDHCGVCDDGYRAKNDDNKACENSKSDEK